MDGNFLLGAPLIGGNTIKDPQSEQKKHKRKRRHCQPWVLKFEGKQIKGCNKVFWIDFK